MIGYHDRVVVSSVEQRVTGDAVAVLAGNKRHPMFMANHLTEPHAFAQSIHHTAGEVLLLLEYLVDSIRAEVRRSAWPSPVDVGRCRFHGRRV